MRNLRLFDAHSLPVSTLPGISDGTYRLYSSLVSMINRMERHNVARTGIIPWGAPVPTFGDLSSSRFATVGLNPSNREFTDAHGNELRGDQRRFHTLHSLGISSWADIDARHLQLILDSCRFYFHLNPYNRWFRPLDHVLSGTAHSYYSVVNSVCHLDLIPYATLTKWTALEPRQRTALLELAGDSLAELLRGSTVRVLLLNGQTVVDRFRDLAGVRFLAQPVPGWSLPRSAGTRIIGLSYTAVIDTLGGAPLDHQLLVLGYNHNLQSSFGVTTEVVAAIRDWVQRLSMEVLP